MKKEHYRDYATAAYRIRARLGSAGNMLQRYGIKPWRKTLGRRARRAAWGIRRKPP